MGNLAQMLDLDLSLKLQRPVRRVPGSGRATADRQVVPAGGGRAALLGSDLRRVRPGRDRHPSALTAPPRAGGRGPGFRRAS